MRTHQPAPAFLAVGILIFAPIPSHVVAAQEKNVPTVSEWTVPWPNSRPRDPAVAPDGRIWFVGQAGNYLAVFNPADKSFDRVEIDPGTHPHNLIVDNNGHIWYAGNRNGMIGRYDPATRQLSRYPMPDSTVRDPHTLLLDGKGHIYFTAQQAGHVGRLNMATGTISLVNVGRGTRPYGIVIDGQGRPYFCEFGTNKIAMIDPATLELKEYQLPEGSRPRRIAVDKDGKTIWYVDFSRGMLGRLDPATGKVTTFDSPSGQTARPYAMTADSEGRIWYVETGQRPNRLIGFDPGTERFVSNIPIGRDAANTIRNMTWDPATRSIWYGSDANMLGVINVPKLFGGVP